MKKFFQNLTKVNFNFFKNISLKDIYKVITDANIQETRKSFVLLWIIVSFTIFIVIWASISEINQVVRANGEVTPESQVHMIQTNLTGPIESVKIKLGDKIQEGDIIFTIARSNYYKAYLSAIEEVKTRKDKVAILEDLLSKGAESQMRVIDEKLLLLDAEKRLNTATTAYNYSEVKSSATGTVSIVNAKNIGQVVMNGDILAEVVPDNANLRLKVQVQTKDIAFVRPEFKAKIAFTSYDMAIYGQFDGVVKTVSASTTLDSEGIPYYTAIVEVDDKEIERLDNIRIQSGMQASVSIISQKRTVLSYLFNPITKLSQTALRE